LKRGFYLVMAAQALSSVADNALLIAAIALVLDLHGPAWLAPLMKWWFALAYVALAAFVGAFADSHPKGRVMFMTNSVKIAGCLLMFFHGHLGLGTNAQLVLVFVAYSLVGIGAAAYSPAKYGIVTEMLPPEQLVKGNSWIEGLTVLSVIVGTVLGGVFLHPDVSSALLSHPVVSALSSTRTEAAILLIAVVYFAAAGCNLLIPRTHTQYPPQHVRPSVLLRQFWGYVDILWRDKLGQISLAVTTLFWGAGATLQLIVIEWGAQHLGYRLDQASILMGVSALGTVLGAILAGRVPLQRALAVLPCGVAMGLVVLFMPVVVSPWAVYTLLLLIGGLAGFFVVPMNALLQHRGHVLLSAGLNTIIVIFGVLVASLMLVIMLWNRRNHLSEPELSECIGQRGHGQAL